MEKQSDSDMEYDHDDHSDVDDSDMKYDDEEEKVVWLGDEEEMKIERTHLLPENDMVDKDRPLFNPASLVTKSFSYVPYPKEEFKDTDMIFWTLQVKPKTMNSELVQMFYWWDI
jgi:hypothetical protein